jgi:hypothetical protein
MSTDKHTSFVNSFQYPSYYTGPKINTIKDISGFAILLKELLRYKQGLPILTAKLLKHDPLPNIKTTELEEIINNIPNDFPVIFPSLEAWNMFLYPKIS